MDKAKTARPRGRPKKVPHVRQNAGRKLIAYGEKMSNTTKWRRAQQLKELVAGDTEIVERVLGICKAQNREVASQSKKSSRVNGRGKIVKRHSPDSAAAFYLEANYSKLRYSALVADSREHGASIYPCYDIVHSALVECLPNNISHDENGASVPLQQLLNKSAERGCETVTEDWPAEAVVEIELTGTIGFDSSSGHLNPQQGYEDENQVQNVKSDQSLLVTSLNIIKIESMSLVDDKYIWVNPRPQSRRLVRPVRIRFEKEDEENTKTEYNRISHEIQNLTRHTFTLPNGHRVNVRYKVFETLYDGKCINTILDNRYTLRCVVCWKTNRDFGNINDNFPADPGALKYGMSLLHVMIKALEHFLHIAYRNIPTLKVWDVPKNLRDSLEANKVAVKERVWDAFRVRVDKVVQGKGTSNTGNVAWRCLREPKKFARALQIDEHLVTDVSNLVRLFRCKKRLKLDEVQNLSRATHRKFYLIYPWAKLSPTLHKFLWHSCEIAREFPLPMIYFSEDGSEHTHKFFRKDMTEHARQIDRKSRILDVFHRALYMSDPKLSLMNMAKKPKKTIKMNDQMKAFIHESETLYVTDGEEEDGDE